MPAHRALLLPLLPLLATLVEEVWGQEQLTTSILFPSTSHLLLQQMVSLIYSGQCTTTRRELSSLLTLMGGLGLYLDEGSLRLEVVAQRQGEEPVEIEEARVGIEEEPVEIEAEPVRIEEETVEIEEVTVGIEEDKELVNDDVVEGQMEEQGIKTHRKETDDTCTLLVAAENEGSVEPMEVNCSVEAELLKKGQSATQALGDINEVFNNVVDQAIKKVRSSMQDEVKKHSHANQDDSNNNTHRQIKLNIKEHLGTTVEIRKSSTGPEENVTPPESRDNVPGQSLECNLATRKDSTQTHLDMEGDICDVIDNVIKKVKSSRQVNTIEKCSTTKQNDQNNISLQFKGQTDKSTANVARGKVFHDVKPIEVLDTDMIWINNIIDHAISNAGSVKPVDITKDPQAGKKAQSPVLVRIQSYVSPIKDIRSHCKVPEEFAVSEALGLKTITKTKKK